MNSNLARALLTKGVIRQGTVVELYYNVRGLSCVRNSQVLSSFVIVRARLLNQCSVVFDALDSRQQVCQVPAEDIIKIDGMLLARIALSHNLTLEGQELRQKQPRGRRKKSDKLTCNIAA